MEGGDFLKELVSLLVPVMLIANFLSIGVTLAIMALMMTIEFPTMFKDLISSSLAMRMPRSRPLPSC